jgi:hypothetical protein
MIIIFALFSARIRLRDGIDQSLKRGKVVPVLSLTEHHAMEAYLESRDIAPRIHDLGTRWR